MEGMLEYEDAMKLLMRDIPAWHYDASIGAFNLAA